MIVARSCSDAEQSHSQPCLIRPPGRPEDDRVRLDARHRTKEIMGDADVLTRMLHALDARDWDLVRASFADEFGMDYTSLWGGEPGTVRADDLVAEWSAFGGGFTATQHLTGPVLTVDDRLHTHVVAHHWLRDAPGGDSWVVYGHYTVRVENGRIAEITLRTFYQEGNRDLPGIVRERVVEASGG
jgi:hypothetical protein